MHVIPVYRLSFDDLKLTTFLCAYIYIHKLFSVWLYIFHHVNTALSIYLLTSPSFK